MSMYDVSGADLSEFHTTMASPNSSTGSSTLLSEITAVAKQAQKKSRVANPGGYAVDTHREGKNIRQQQTIIASKPSQQRCERR
jgi:transglutaminase/protease-like cytokinesis protein 3